MNKFNTQRLLFIAALIWTHLLPSNQSLYDDADLGGCTFQLDGYIFNLQGLSRTNASLGDYHVQYPDDSGTTTINFNVCRETFRKCPDEGQDFANQVNSNNTCNHMSGNKLSKVGVSLIDEKKPYQGIRLQYKGGNLCNDTDYFSLMVQLNCDATVLMPTYALDTSSITHPCTPKVIMTSKEACPAITLHALWTFFTKYYYIFGLAMVFGGVWLMLFGGKQFRVTMFFAGQLAVTAALLLILFSVVFPAQSPNWLVWIALIVSLGIGSGVGYSAQKWPRIGVLFVGAWMGGFIGSLLFKGIFYSLSEENPLLGLYLTIAFCSIIIAVFSMIFFDYAILIGSSIGGAYLFVRGISEFSGGYVNEVIMYEQYQNNTLNELKVQIYVYFMLMVAFATMSLMFQFKQRKKDFDSYNYRQYDFKYRK